VLQLAGEPAGYDLRKVRLQRSPVGLKLVPVPLVDRTLKRVTRKCVLASEFVVGFLLFRAGVAIALANASSCSGVAEPRTRSSSRGGY
jgi:hypothetical protein